MALKPGDRVIADASGGWRRGVVQEVYGKPFMRMYGIRFTTPLGPVVVIYPRHSLRRLTGDKAG